ncbi:hypothetical protein Bbelb_147860 [Branchiostoma belcheri]|nr:hypothetical protein Bbelb_147860 [Branchiostoma belcheri]
MLQKPFIEYERLLRTSGRLSPPPIQSSLRSWRAVPSHVDRCAVLPTRRLSLKLSPIRADLAVSDNIVSAVRSVSICLPLRVRKQAVDSLPSRVRASQFYDTCIGGEISRNETSFACAPVSSPEKSRAFQRTIRYLTANNVTWETSIIHIHFVSGPKKRDALSHHYRAPRENIPGTTRLTRPSGRLSEGGLASERFLANSPHDACQTKDEKKMLASDVK